jgi:hypothetical protein
MSAIGSLGSSIRKGRPQWSVVVEVLSATSYLVQYPDGKTEILVDSE